MVEAGFTSKVKTVVTIPLNPPKPLPPNPSPLLIVREAFSHVISRQLFADGHRRQLLS